MENRIPRQVREAAEVEAAEVAAATLAVAKAQVHTRSCLQRRLGSVASLLNYQSTPFTCLFVRTFRECDGHGIRTYLARLFEGVAKESGRAAALDRGGGRGRRRSRRESGAVGAAGAGGGGGSAKAGSRGCGRRGSQEAGAFFNGSSSAPTLRSFVAYPYDDDDPPTHFVAPFPHPHDPLQPTPLPHPLTHPPPWEGPAWGGVLPHSFNHPSPGKARLGAALDAKLAEVRGAVEEQRMLDGEIALRLSAASRSTLLITRANYRVHSHGPLTRSTTGSTAEPMDRNRTNWSCRVAFTASGTTAACSPRCGRGRGWPRCPASTPGRRSRRSRQSRRLSQPPGRPAGATNHRVRRERRVREVRRGR